MRRLLGERRLCAVDGKGGWFLFIRLCADYGHTLGGCYICYYYMSFHLKFGSVLDQVYIIKASTFLLLSMKDGNDK